MSYTITILTSNLLRTRKFSPFLTGWEGSCFWHFPQLSRVDHALRPIFFSIRHNVTGELILKIYAAFGNLFTDS